MQVWYYRGYVIRKVRTKTFSASYYMILKDGKRVDSRLSAAAARRFINTLVPVWPPAGSVKVRLPRKRNPAPLADPNHSLWAHRNKVKMTD